MQVEVSADVVDEIEGLSLHLIFVGRPSLALFLLLSPTSNGNTERNDDDNKNGEKRQEQVQGANSDIIFSTSEKKV